MMNFKKYKLIYTLIILIISTLILVFGYDLFTHEFMAGILATLWGIFIGVFATFLLIDPFSTYLKAENWLNLRKDFCKSVVWDIITVMLDISMIKDINFPEDEINQIKTGFDKVDDEVIKSIENLRSHINDYVLKNGEQTILENFKEKYERYTCLNFNNIRNILVPRAVQNAVNLKALQIIAKWDRSIYLFQCSLYRKSEDLNFSETITDFIENSINVLILSQKVC